MPKKPTYGEVAHQQRLVCEKAFEHEKRVDLVKKVMRQKASDPGNTRLRLQLEFLNMVTLLKLPHGLACLATLIFCMGSLVLTLYVSTNHFCVGLSLPSLSPKVLCVQVMLSSVREFSEHEAQKSTTGGMGQKMVTLGNKIA